MKFLKTIMNCLPVNCVLHRQRERVPKAYLCSAHSIFTSGRTPSPKHSIVKSPSGTSDYEHVIYVPTCRKLLHVLKISFPVNEWHVFWTFERETASLPSPAAKITVFKASSSERRHRRRSHHRSYKIVASKAILAIYLRRGRRIELGRA